MSAASVAVRRPQWAGAAGYLTLLVGGVGLFLLVRELGTDVSAPPPPVDAPPVGRGKPGQVDVVRHVLATLAAVIGLGYVLGRLFRRLGQPPVIGEVVAGILLGPTLLGWAWPAAQHQLIPPPAIDPNGQVSAAVKGVAQLGVILYMFLVGLELNAAVLRRHARAVVVISHASIVVPFVLGAGFALALYPARSHAGVPFTSFALFLGVAMAITAFPVLARILDDRRIERTELGTMALGSAAIGDVTAWCLLALVVGVAKAEVGGAAVVVVGAGLFVAVMFAVVRPLAARLSAELDAAAGPLPAAAVPMTFLCVLVSALATEWIGVHALFGAFLLGAVLPSDGRLATEFGGALKVPTTVLLLPAFFAYTGMRTEIGLMSGWTDWAWCAGIVLVATVGKFGGTLLAARLTGRPWRESAALGVLMNTRGLMELIVLNVGLDLGVISPTVFAMMVVMALVTTMTTAPVVGWLLRDTPPASGP